MKHISFKKFKSALDSVWRELCGLGLSESRLAGVEVFHCNVPQLLIPLAFGFFTHDLSRIDKFFGYKKGCIYISRWIINFGHHSVRDVVRHEYGHAFAHYYPELVTESDEFPDVFGREYFHDKRTKSEPVTFISAYAATNPAEDFAETFMVAIRRGCKPLPRSLHPEVRRKYSFVTGLIKRIRGASVRRATSSLVS